MALALLLIISPSVKGGFSPIGRHQATLGKGSGFGGATVSTAGSYTSSIPLDLPPPRGDLPLPVAVVYTGLSRAGAAGSGWIVPLTFIHRSKTTSGRKPDPDGSVESKLFLHMRGSRTLMVPTGETLRYRPRVARRYLELEGTAVINEGTHFFWDLHDEAGRTYHFENIDRLHASNFWFLTEIVDATGNNRVELSYEVDTHSYCYDSGPDIPDLLLKEVAYSHNAKDIPKHKVKLEYRPVKANASSSSTDNSCPNYQVLGLRTNDGLHLKRMKVLDRLKVLSEETHLRSYLFEYQTGPDHALPQLHSVELLGQDENSTLPVRNFEYGSATLNNDTPNNLVDDTIALQSSGTLSLNTTYLGKTWQVDEPILTGSFPPVVEATWLHTNQMLRDFTGDGLPDHVYPTDAGLVLQRNGASTSGINLTDPGAISELPMIPMHDSDTPQGIVLQMRKKRDGKNYLETWRNVLDWNGDGRMDIVEVDPNHKNRWILHLNTPGTGAPGSITWETHHVDVKALRNELKSRGHKMSTFRGVLPLSRQRTHYGWNEQYELWHWEDPGDPGPEDNTWKWTIEKHKVSAEEGKTVTLWKLDDANGDGLVDFLFNHAKYTVDKGCFTTWQDPWLGYNLHLTSVEATSELRQEGRALVLVALVAGNLHIRIFDVDGEIVVDKPENDLIEGQDLADLEELIPFPVSGESELSPDEKQSIFEKATSVTGYTAAPLCGSLKNKGKPGVVQRDHADGPPYPIWKWNALVAEKYNKIQVFYNTSNDDQAHENFSPTFTSSPEILLATRWPLELWRSGVKTPLGQDPFMDETLWRDNRGASTQVSGFVDANGDGFLDFVEEETAVRLSDGRTEDLGGFSVKMRLPGPAARLWDDATATCEEDPTFNDHLESRREAGLVDLSGDGIPDYVSDQSVRIGTGAGFGPSLSAGNLENLSLSRRENGCRRSTRVTYGGLFDLDGDGRPSYLEKMAAGKFEVFTLRGSSGLGAHSAGRLVRAGNGYGGGETIRYGNAKLDGVTAHQNPASEIVVTEVRPDGQSDPPLEPSRFAYGDTHLMFHPVLELWEPTNYGVRVTLRGRSNPNVKMRGTLPFEQPLGIDAIVPDASREVFPDRSKPNSKLRGTVVIEQTLGVDDIAPNAYEQVLVGRVVERDLIKGANLSPDPRNHLGYAAHGFDPTAVASAGSELDHDTKELSGSTDPDEQYGYAYTAVQRRWQGQTGSGYNHEASVSTQTEVAGIDSYGRATYIQHLNDLKRDRDNVCETIRYAEPTTEFGPRNGPKVVRLGTCRRSSDWKELGRINFQYDGLPFGEVDAGLVSKRIVTQFNTTTGQQVGQHVAANYVHDAHGNVTIVNRPRSDGVSRKTTYSYGPFGLALESVTSTASDVATPLTTTFEHDPVTLLPTRVVDANGVEYTTLYDAFGRPTQSSVDGHETRKWTYSDTSSPRRISRVTYHDWNTSTGATEQTTYIDALGRPYKASIHLGSDYGDKTLVTRYVNFDALGRIAFSANPFLDGEPPEQQYGMSYHYDNLGRLKGTVAGPGSQPLTSTPDPENDIYPTRLFHDFAGFMRRVRVMGSNELGNETAAAGAFDEEYFSAIGRTLRRSRFKGEARMLHATFAYDPLGRVTAIRRWQQPEGDFSDRVNWLLSYDTHGRVLEIEEPDASPRKREYNDWGQLLKSTYVDEDGIERGTERSYDGFGRIRKMLYLHGDPYIVRRVYHYDESSTDHFVVHPNGTENPAGPSHLKGRLAWIDEGFMQEDGTYERALRTYFSYDRLGRRASIVRELERDNFRRFSEGRLYGPSGVLHSLGFHQPDDHSEQIVYTYDSAMRLNRVTRGAQPLFEATDIDELGRYISIQFGNGVADTRFYRPDHRRELQSKLLNWGSNWRRIEYAGLDGEGRLLGQVITTSTDAPDQVQSFEYGPAERLKRVWTQQITNSPDGPSTQITADETFFYDGLGNLVTITDAVGPNSLAVSTDPDDPDRIRGGPLIGGALVHFYDQRGNVVRRTDPDGTERRFSYNQENQLATLAKDQDFKARLAWDSTGALRAMTEFDADQVTRERNWFSDSMEEDFRVEENRRIWTLRIPGPGSIVASLRREVETGQRAIVFHHGDHRADRLFTDGDGSVVQRVKYRPFGQITSDSGDPDALNYTDELWNGGRFLSRYGITMLGVRPYEARTGRFLQRDPFGVIHGASRSNPYAFAFNDPVNQNDPTGLYPYIVKALGDIVNSALGSSVGGGSIPAQIGVNLAVTALENRGSIAGQAEKLFGRRVSNFERAARIAATSVAKDAANEAQGVLLEGTTAVGTRRLDASGNQLVSSGVRRQLFPRSSTDLVVGRLEEDAGLRLLDRSSTWKRTANIASKVPVVDLSIQGPRIIGGIEEIVGGNVREGVDQVLLSAIEFVPYKWTLDLTYLAMGPYSPSLAQQKLWRREAIARELNDESIAWGPVYPHMINLGEDWMGDDWTIDFGYDWRGGPIYLDW